MKIYFDGCSHTWGAGLETPELSRYSKIVSDHFGAEEYNIAQRGGSDKRVLRNLLETDLEEYDCIIVQLTCMNRTEFFDDDNKEWVQINLEGFKKGYQLPSSRLSSGRLSETKNRFWNSYWRDIYTEDLGRINQMTIGHAMKNLLKDKKHLIIGISGRGGGHVVSAPVDINFANFESPNTISFQSGSTKHPSEEGHKTIAEEIIQCISM